MSDNRIIDFEAAKDRRTEAEIERDQEQWQVLVRGLTELMATSGLSDVAVTSASLFALLEVLQDGGRSLNDAKQAVARMLAES